MLHKAKFMFLLMFIGLLLTVALTPLAAQQDISPVAQDGPYEVGLQMTKLTDETREDRTLQAFIWYPALVTKDAKPPYAPDTSGAPYPLIIYSHGYTGSPTEAVEPFINRLVSQGYIVAGVNHNDTNDVGRALINRPLDILFLLNQLADLKDDNPLFGLIDTNHVGVIGYSAGSYTSLAAGGARIDPASLPEWCATSTSKPGVDYCGWLLPYWDAMIVYHDRLLPATNDNLWAATTDDRIRAIGLIAPCFAQFLGAAGIAQVIVPTIMFAGTSDTTCVVDVDASSIYQNLSMADRYLLTLKGRNHGTVMDEQVLEPYASAFFGLYLQGKTDYAQYLTPESASTFRNVTLEWQLSAASGS